MSSPITEKLRNALSESDWNQAVTLLERFDAPKAAEALGELSFEQQQRLFRHLPLGLAAALVAHFPYYHQYVLLHSRPAEEMRALVDQLDPNDRIRLFDELPEEAWQQLMDELSGEIAVETLPQHEPEMARPPEQDVPHPADAIIEARHIGKCFEQPDGNEIEVIAPLDLSVESGTICALLGH